jgi:hypothetical protein
MSVCMSVFCWAAVVFSLGSVLRTRCRGITFLLIIIIRHLLLDKGGVFLSVSSEDPLARDHLFLIIIKYEMLGASGSEAEIQPELHKGEVVKNRHAWINQLKTEIKWKINVKWGTLLSYHSCVRGVSTGYGQDSRVWIPGRGKMFLFSTTSRPVLGHTPPPIQWVPGASFSGAKNLWKS